MTADQLIQDLRFLLSLCDQGRAHAIHDHLADPVIGPICETLGYGAVMDSAQRLWELKDHHGCFTIGPCRGSVVDAIKRIDAYRAAPVEYTKEIRDEAFKAYNEQCRAIPQTMNPIDAAVRAALAAALNHQKQG